MPSCPLAPRRNRRITRSPTLLPQVPRQQRPRFLHRLGAMADAVFHLERKFRKRFCLAVRKEERIISEPAAAALGFEDRPVADSLGAIVQPVLVRDRHHTAKPRGAL